LAVGFYPKNLAFARKIMVLSDSGGRGGVAAPWLLGLYSYGLDLCSGKH